MIRFGLKISTIDCYVWLRNKFQSTFFDYLPLHFVEIVLGYKRIMINLFLVAVNINRWLHLGLMVGNLLAVSTTVNPCLKFSTPTNAIPVFTMYFIVTFNFSTFFQITYPSSPGLTISFSTEESNLPLDCIQSIYKWIIKVSMSYVQCHLA